MGLFEASKGSVVRGYLLLKKNGKNLPPRWIENARSSRKKREEKLPKILTRFFRKLKLKTEDQKKLKDWEAFYQKECFYNGIRILFELEREGKTKR